MSEAVLPLLVGEGEGQVLEDIEIKFPEKVVEIEEPEKKVEIERCVVIPGKVIVTGRVIKNITFKTRCQETVLPGDRRPTRVICGDVRHCTAFIPFKLFIEIPGAAPGDECTVVEACIPGEVDTLVDDTGDGFFDRLVETIDIRVVVRVVRDAVVKVPAARRPLMAKFVPFPHL